MPDTFGAIQFPVAVPAAQTAAGDPALTTLASYLSAVLNANCGAAWAASGVCPGRNVVERAYTHDPRVLFDDSKLPALYLWCFKGRLEDIAADIAADIRTLNILWVLEGGQEDHQTKRLPMFNAVAKAVRRAVRIGRDPSWIVAGDTDPSAATEGSLLMEHARISRITVGPYQPQNVEIFITDGEGRPMPFPALAMSFDITEFLVDDPTRFTYPAATDVDIFNTADEQVGAVEDLPL